MAGLWAGAFLQVYWVPIVMHGFISGAAAMALELPGLCRIICWPPTFSELWLIFLLEALHKVAILPGCVLGEEPAAAMLLLDMALRTTGKSRTFKEIQIEDYKLLNKADKKRFGKGKRGECCCNY